MKRKSAIFRGLAAVMAFLMLISVTATTLTFQYDGIINGVLGLKTSQIVTLDDSVEVNDIYYDNEYGFDNQALLSVKTDAAAVNVQIVEEGAVLLKNDNAALPLTSDSRVTIFGNAAVNSAIYETMVPSYMQYNSFLSAMESQFGADNLNEVLCTEVYAGMNSTSTSEVQEAPISAVTAYESTWQNDYNDAAIVVLGRDANEGNDIYMYSATETYSDGSPRRMLDLSVNEVDLLSYLQQQKASGIFDKIVVIISSEYQMELGFLDVYDVDAALLVGECGSYGTTAIAEILVGAVNPSGRVVDTYAANSLSAPATLYAGHENTYQWTNADEVNATVNDNDSNGAQVDWYVIYAEGIYVGYKYYETRYEDAVMGTGNATSAVGSSTGSAWNYADEIVYTFGHGLSYTTFEEKLGDVSFDAASGNYLVEVTVTNTGDVAGKDVVEVYAQTPYGDYERTNLVEKASINLMGFEKTDSLAPGASQTVTVEVPRYFLASYDENNAKGYILSAGDYYLAIGDDAHDALNNILAAKGYTTANGMTADGDADKTYTWNQAELDTESYRISVYTDYEVTNTFDSADPSYYGYDFTYLSRNDWAGTFPTEVFEMEATDEIMSDLDSGWYETPADAPAVSDFAQGVDNGISFIDMRLVDFEDDEAWDAFLDQFTVEELAHTMDDDLSWEPIARLGVPGGTRSNDNLNPTDNCGAEPEKWTTEANTSRTWNKDMFTARGHYVGLETTIAGGAENWYGGGDLHRTPFGGRANQYYSEDGNMGYIVGYYEAQACQAAGTIYCVKHFALNDQETQRQGVSTFSSEQALREIYLRAFEGAFAGGALSTMCGLNRIGCTYCPQNSNLVTTVLRDEWGFQGHVTSDGYTGLGYMSHYVEDLVAGLDYACMDSNGDHAAGVMAAIDAGDGYVLQCLRLAAKRNFYTMLHSMSVNGISSNSVIVTIVPWWQTALLAVNAVTCVGFVVFTVLAVVAFTKKKKPAVKETKEV